MIIALSGYAGSGKDAVAHMIQLINCNNTGNMPIDEIFENIYHHQGWMEYQSKWKIKRFSGKLKEFASMLTGIPVDALDSQSVKKSALPRCWWTINEDGEEPMTVRDMLQKLGTDAIRDGLHPNAWVNALMSDYVSTHDFEKNKTVYPNWVITDCRFPNEAQAIKEMGGVIVRVDRPGVGPVNGHPSETALDNWKFDYKIMNNSDLECLRLTTEVVFKKII